MIIDELGYLPFETSAAHLLFQLVSRRYERGSLLITSSRSVGDWGEVFGDPVVATAILHRLLHHSHVLTIRGESYGLREKRRSGLIRAGLTGSGEALLPPPVGRSPASLRAAEDSGQPWEPHPGHCYGAPGYGGQGPSDPR